MTEMIDPAPYIAFVDALNAIDRVTRQKGHPLAPIGLLLQTDNQSFMGEMDLGHYTVEYDSEADRWTLVAETDAAPDLCSFNQTRDECSETDPCERCIQVQVELAEEQDRVNG